MIRKIYELAEESNQIIAINQSQPHKSNSVLRDYFKDKKIPKNVDSLIKNKDNQLVCYNLNSTAFTGWFEENVTTFNQKIVVIKK